MMTFKDFINDILTMLPNDLYGDPPTIGPNMTAVLYVIHSRLEALEAKLAEKEQKSETRSLD